MITLIGTVAAILTTVCWLPQVIKTTRTREAGDFHWLYLAMLGIGIAAWFTYGILQHDAPIYLANGITLCLVAVIAIVKARQGAGASELGLRDPGDRAPSSPALFRTVVSQERPHRDRVACPRRTRSVRIQTFDRSRVLERCTYLHG